MDRDVLTRHLEPVVGSEVERAIMTYAERLEQEGIETGERQMMQRLLERLLERRFGQIPEAAAAILDAAQLVELQRWFDRALDASSLDEVLNT